MAFEAIFLIAFFVISVGLGGVFGAETRPEVVHPERKPRIWI
ncbi:MAG TPA: hypothetical protein VHG69_10570 [Thermoleophilaceae bacterium]|nr:hypothetical protein [Thermoleophilaceae bacterium]